MKDRLIIKILKEGDRVLNVWHSNGEIYVVVRKPNEEVFVHSIAPDENGQPRLSTAPEVTITNGDGVVEAWATDENAKQVFSLTA